uniref:W2 domain-containing protein n=1 Tax=Compsopogon caeruleus TaxID=31354 RepID=A0A7S1T844_9RHOD|mmetsp:Transcript_12757/g.25883  ORF Transcript_12757/g.25883 Transcript_12757/m.25883 type:complete len:404 (+) Transcript_12757:705-1916(+)|eukprot:CAMPEP_0184678296 /NCGR_PEP_ID=MMETSP0312-20130426/1033_1 /TAXON_ID=31354 /ORGANISM="Compsopogon coeruleus, Strain SAG 36.94" /LENGTH=403 /DNA_ID=CAMNT_0027126937 /DNA_START=680 /DNA_END=1891 /DNA_ORIENTATION=+
MAQSGNVNIMNVDDQFNRYKMPPIVGKVEGRGNGIKTRIVNCSDVGKALHRPPGYICRFFGYELGAQTQINDGEGVYIVNGEHSQRVLVEALQKFIDGFVLCNNCKLPETSIAVKKEMVRQECASCGHSEEVDNLHKLASYIVKVHKKDKQDKAKAKAKKDEKKAKKDDDKSKGKKRDETEEERAERRSRRKAEKEAKASLGVEDDDDNVVWSTDTSDAAIAQRAAEAEAASRLLEGVKIESPADKLAKAIRDGKQGDSVVRRAMKASSSHSGVAAKTIMEAYFLESDSMKQTDLVEAILVCLRAVDMDDDAKNLLVGSLDDMVKEGAVDSKPLKAIPFILKGMYDDDLMDEDKIIAWHESKPMSAPAEALRLASKDLVDWLKTAESESEDDDDEVDDDEDIE